ncbi:MAG: class I SAM-dependent methyltransferase [Flavobacteriaceae bacterium]|nr:class I SAM-dependent methyltransferase [Flavobacteriaceae bacterium]
MLTKQDKDHFRGTIFSHLDGLVTAPTALALHQAGLIDHLKNNKTCRLNDLASAFKANKGYLNIGLRILCSQGWLSQQILRDEQDVEFKTTKNGLKAFDMIHCYDEAVQWLGHAVDFPNQGINPNALHVLDKCCANYSNNYGIDINNSPEVSKQVLSHIEGAIVSPLIVLLGMNGFFHKYFMEASFRAQEYHRDPENFKKILNFLTQLEWFNKKNETYRFNPKGLFFAQRATAYGVTVSYLPTLTRLDELIFGSPTVLKQQQGDEAERHVHREMNVWGSGGAHSTYFRAIDKIIIDLFNKPIEDQPKGILDMGCGNGAFIQHAFDVIENQTERGKMLDEHPLFLVGVDFNRAALKVTRANLIKADIWAKVIWGDIGRPDKLATDLQEDYGIALSDLLNVRTFLDHNRIWETPQSPRNLESKSTGAYAFEGHWLSNDLVEDSLLEHFKKWKPFVERFGLLIIELHTLAPEVTAANLRKTPATAYDATHGYSDQYILEIDLFSKLADEAGLTPDENYSRKFPDNELATVSINLLKGTN